MYLRGRQKHFNPRSPHGERPYVDDKAAQLTTISTHAPRTGSDSGSATVTVTTGKISTHAPRTGSDNLMRQSHNLQRLFQPTLPARGATGASGEGCKQKSISTHAPRTGSDMIAGAALYSVSQISTHAPRTGSDYKMLRRQERINNFNPRSPHGERHGVCAGRCVGQHFNPRSPHGERRHGSQHDCRAGSFQPTLPARGATTAKMYEAEMQIFQPTLPARGATSANSALAQIGSISTHAPRTGSDGDNR